MKHICILGSINMDEVMRVDRLVKSGETIFAKEYNKYPGGKGANQTVAAKRLGANVYMIGKIGIDSNGSNLLKSLQDDKVNTEYVYKDIANHTGMAIISVDDEGNNSIIVIPGANMAINKKEITDSDEGIKNASQKFIEKGVNFVITTLGDSFIGGLCSVFEKEEDINYEVIKKATKFGNKVSGIVVQRRGA